MRYGWRCVLRLWQACGRRTVAHSCRRAAAVSPCITISWSTTATVSKTTLCGVPTTSSVSIRTSSRTSRTTSAPRIIRCSSIEAITHWCSGRSTCRAVRVWRTTPWSWARSSTPALSSLTRWATRSTRCRAATSASATTSSSSTSPTAVWWSMWRCRPTTSSATPSRRSWTTSPTTTSGRPPSR